ncbi:MAG: carbonic anhydrase [Synergistales bacterium]
MERILDGYREFKKTADREAYGRLAKGQAPHTLVVSCSDSRIIPEAIFSAKPGELFVLRNVGNVCRLDDPSVACAVEYAVNHLKVGSLVVLAHSDCGAVKAVEHKEHLDSPGLVDWLCEECFDGCDLDSAIKASGIRQFERISTHPAVKAAVEAGHLEVGLLFFDLGTLGLARYNGKDWDRVC